MGYTDNLKKVLDAKKHQSPLVAPIEMMLAGRSQWETRRSDVIHPSELAAGDCCPRAIWYRLTEHPADVKPDHMVREVIFAEGHEYHRKWQTWAWDAGLLRGQFMCVACKAQWSDTSPKECTHCGAGRIALTYREVPVRDDDLNISGHADGLLVDPDHDEDWLLEVKSIGEGTVRYDDPKRLMEYTYDVGGHKVTDLKKVWQSIRTPMAGHLLQVGIYAAILGIRKAVLLYEFKPDGRYKEFPVKLRPDTVRPQLDLAAHIMDSVRSGKAPDCSKKGGGCARCKPFEKAGASEEGDGPPSSQRRRREASARRGGGARRASRR